MIIIPGLPRKYAKMGFKKGWRAYRKTKGRHRVSRSNPKRSPRGGSKTMGKRGFLSTQTLMKFVRLGALAAPAISELANASLPMQTKFKNIVRHYTGWETDNRTWHWQNLLQGWLPYLGAVIVTYGIPKVVSMIRRL